MPSVTICIPARNEEDHIADCLRSVLAIYWRAFTFAIGRAPVSWKGADYIVAEQSSLRDL